MKFKFKYKCPKLSCQAVTRTLSEQKPGPICTHGKPASVNNKPEVMLPVK